MCTRCWDAWIFGCYHVHWKKCPTALKGQYQGREKYATIALESVVDYNLWFWHASFGFPGTMNDINIWERSSLLESMLNGKHEEIDHEFTLDRKQCNKLFYLFEWNLSLIIAVSWTGDRSSNEVRWKFQSQPGGITKRCRT